jgi:magnesium transporter
MDSDPATLAAALRDPAAVFWLDISKPTDDEYSLLDEVFGFHPLAIEDTMVYTQRPKIESYNHIGDACKHGYFYMVIHGPDLNQFKENLKTKELDMFVSQGYLVTVHEEPIRSLEVVHTRAKADSRVVLDNGIDMLLHSILDHLVDGYIPILDYFQDALDELEEKSTSEPTQSLLMDIAATKRNLLNLRRIIGPQREVLAQLTRGEVPFIRETTRIYLRDVLDHLVRAVETIELYRDLVMGCRDIYMSSINNHLNQIMKTLTIISVIALPMTVVTSFFGMNFVETAPGMYGHVGLVILFMVMLAVPATLLVMFWKKKWL